MAIRLRMVNGHWIAVCAAKTKAKKGDIYLDDNMHHALTEKFALDFTTMGWAKGDIVDPMYEKLMEEEEE